MLLCNPIIPFNIFGRQFVSLSLNNSHLFHNVLHDIFESRTWSLTSPGRFAGKKLGKFFVKSKKGVGVKK